MTTSLQTLDAAIAQLTTDASADSAAVTKLVTAYAQVSADIKALLTNAQGGHPIDYSAELAKVEASDANVVATLQGVQGVTAAAVQDDETIRDESGASNFGEIPGVAAPAGNIRPGPAQP